MATVKRFLCWIVACSFAIGMGFVSVLEGKLLYLIPIVFNALVVGVNVYEVSKMVKRLQQSDDQRIEP